MTMKRSCDQCMHCRYIAKGDFGHYCYKHRECMTADQVDTLGCDEFWPRAIIGQPTCDTCRYLFLVKDRVADDSAWLECMNIDAYAGRKPPVEFCSCWKISDHFERTGKRMTQVEQACCDDKLGLCECE